MSSWRARTSRTLGLLRVTLGIGISMDLRGLEWAVPAFEIVMLVLPVYAFVVFYRRVKYRALKKTSALWLYASVVIAPIILYTLFFFLLAGLEELTHISLISEELSRSLLILVALGVAIWSISILAFGLTLMFLRCEP